LGLNDYENTTDFFHLLLMLSGLCYSQEDTQTIAAELIEDLADSKDKFKAIDRLHKLGILAFPSLFEHFSDKRYCLSEDSMATDRIYKLPVGVVCRRIVNRQIQHYIRWEDEPDPRGLPGFSTRLIPIDDDEAQAWWEKNKNKELWELQAEFIDRVVQENQDRLVTLPAGTARDKCLVAISRNMKLAESIRRDKKPKESKPFRPYKG
jgi:hypothetical protein